MEHIAEMGFNCSTAVLRRSTCTMQYSMQPQSARLSHRHYMYIYHQSASGLYWVVHKHLDKDGLLWSSLQYTCEVGQRVCAKNILGYIMQPYHKPPVPHFTTLTSTCICTFGYNWTEYKAQENLTSELICSKVLGLPDFSVISQNVIITTVHGQEFVAMKKKKKKEKMFLITCTTRPKAVSFRTGVSASTVMSTVTGRFFCHMYLPAQQSLYFTTLYFKTTLIIRPPMWVPNCNLVQLLNLYFKTTCSIRPHFHGPMGGLYHCTCFLYRY